MILHPVAMDWDTRDSLQDKMLIERWRGIGYLLQATKSHGD